MSLNKKDLVEEWKYQESLIGKARRRINAIKALMREYHAIDDAYEDMRNEEQSRSDEGARNMEQVETDVEDRKIKVRKEEKSTGKPVVIQQFICVDCSKKFPSILKKIDAVCPHCGSIHIENTV